MKIGLIDVDYKSSKYPNLALMKISKYHKNQGDVVYWYNPFDIYDIVYKSKIFNFTEDDYTIITNAQLVKCGGTGYDFKTELPQEIDMLQPDYSIYNVPNDTAYGFLTRGCCNSCSWCVVPTKEGKIRPYMDVEDIAIDGRKNLILMDNNILALPDYSTQQLEKIIKLNLKVDFNQALDPRLVTADNAKLLARMRTDMIRFGCDTHNAIEHCVEAMRMIDQYRKKRYMLYTMLHGDIRECYNRLMYWKAYPNVRLMAQPYRDTQQVNKIPMWQLYMARWANRPEIYTKCDLLEYKPRKGVVLKQYF